MLVSSFIATCMLNKHNNINIQKYMEIALVADSQTCSGVPALRWLVVRNLFSVLFTRNRNALVFRCPGLVHFLLQYSSYYS
jgi:hypothetical protein